MPYDYPGEYAVRFDGDTETKPAAVCKRFFDPRLGFVLRSAPFGTLKLEGLVPTIGSGDTLIHRWQRSGLLKRDLIIEGKNPRSSRPTSWRVHNARVLRWHVSPSASKNEVAIETLEIVHEGFHEN